MIVDDQLRRAVWAAAYEHALAEICGMQRNDCVGGVITCSKPHDKQVGSCRAWADFAVMKLETP